MAKDLKYNYVIIIGEKEISSGRLSVHRRDGKDELIGIEDITLEFIQKMQNYE